VRNSKKFSCNERTKTRERARDFCAVYGNEEEEEEEAAAE
jgi:hypothetical protein